MLAIHMMPARPPHDATAACAWHLIKSLLISRIPAKFWAGGNHFKLLKAGVEIP
jgi:hypothetical protein